MCWLPSFAAVICIVSMLRWMSMSIHSWTLFTWLRDHYATFKLLLLLLLSKHWFQWLLTMLQEYFTQLSLLKPVIKSVNVVWNTNVLSCWRNVSSDRKALTPTWHGFVIFMVLVVQISETWQLFCDTDFSFYSCVCPATKVAGKSETFAVSDERCGDGWVVWAGFWNKGYCTRRRSVDVNVDTLFLQFILELINFSFHSAPVKVWRQYR